MGIILREREEFSGIYFEIDAVKEAIMAIDSVCKMEVDEDTSLKREFEGKNYYFCSAICKSAFEKEPHRYAEED